MSGKPEEVRRIAENRKARFEYELLEELECGIVLTGTEVKSLRSGGGSIQEAYAMVRGTGLWLVKSHIPEYKQGNVHNHEPGRERKLLASAREIARWHAAAKEKGVTMVPLSMYFRGSRVKVLLGLCRGKKLHDKRATLKEREDRREVQRASGRRR
ncbi:MAG: SsrA-binding protein SmpB [Planctomycetes bacterium]|nr:SsrA-binding protein SmpB [Planctomycetota bacterium]